MNIKDHEFDAITTTFEQIDPGQVFQPLRGPLCIKAVNLDVGPPRAIRLDDGFEYATNDLGDAIKPAARVIVYPQATVSRYGDA